MNTRDEIAALASISAGQPVAAPPVEWRVEAAPVAYETALAVMEARAAAIAAGEADELIWLLEHPPLYTAGTSARPEHLLEPRFPVFSAGRGGQFTYAVLDLKRRGSDVRRFVADLEEWLIRTLAAFNIRGERREDRVGVWVRRPDKGVDCEDKIAAIGVRVKRWVSLHGVSLNVDPDLSHFAGIVPCGVGQPRFGVTSFLDLGHVVSMPEVDMALQRAFGEVFGRVAREA